MARFGIKPQIGRLVERPSPDTAVIDGYLVPNRSTRSKGASNVDNDGVKILSLCLESAELRIFPTHTIPTSGRFLNPKYPVIRTLTVPLDSNPPTGLRDILETLPSGFVKDYEYGLGLLKPCNRLVRLVEENTSCDEILFIAGGTEVVEDGNVLRFGLTRFARIWKELDLIDQRGSRATSRVKDAFVHNDLAAVLRLEHIDYSLGRHPVSGFVAKAADGNDELTKQERDRLIDVVVSESVALAQERPEGFQKLHREVELVNLDRLIQSYEESLSKSTNEAHWQQFFDKNSFALQQVFGAPMVIAQSGAAVGGGRLNGSGGKIADYLVKNTLTNNIALVEIKKPTTPLLGKEYRPRVFVASQELDGAITQVLDQAYQLVTNLATMKHNTRDYNLEAYAVSCFVIAGRSPSSTDVDRQKSFELYRANSRNVRVVTYDEVLEQLKILRTFLHTPDTTETSEGETSS